MTDQTDLVYTSNIYVRGWKWMSWQRPKTRKRRNNKTLKRTATSHGSKIRLWISPNSLSTKAAIISKLSFFKNQEEIAVLFYSWLQISAFFHAAERCWDCHWMPMFFCDSQNVAPSTACVLSWLLYFILEEKIYLTVFCKLVWGIVWRMWRQFPLRLLDFLCVMSFLLWDWVFLQ